MDSEEHAEPEWAAMPDRSRPSSTASARTPPTATFTMCGARRRCHRAPARRRPTWPPRRAHREAPGGGLLPLEPSRLAERSCRRTETDDADHVLETAASCPLLRTTDDERLEAQAPADDEGSGARRAARTCER